ncbi:MAG: hypothetical protein GC181_13410 [Bacteroidetes bacterium]|nr:hypothetical protein [Bacteroidota bacterium]
MAPKSHQPQPKPLCSIPTMTWSRNIVMQSSKKADVLINDIAEGLELEKSFFIHQIVHSIYPFISRRNRFEGVAKNGEFRIFGERLTLGLFMPFIITLKGKIESDDQGSKLNIEAYYTLFGKYFSISNFLIAIVLIAKMIFENDLTDFGLVIFLVLNAVIGLYLFPIWAEWNFTKVKKELGRIITEHNLPYSKCG